MHGVTFSPEMPGSDCLLVLKAIPKIERERVLIDNLLVRIHFIIVMIRWTGLAPWEFEEKTKKADLDQEGAFLGRLSGCCFLGLV